MISKQVFVGSIKFPLNCDFVIIIQQRPITRIYYKVKWNLMSRRISHAGNNWTMLWVCKRFKKKRVLPVSHEFKLRIIITGHVVVVGLFCSSTNKTKAFLFSWPWVEEVRYWRSSFSWQGFHVFITFWWFHRYVNNILVNCIPK